MHPSRFDHLTRSLNPWTSRRSAIALVLGVGGLAGSHPDEGRAKKKKAKPNQFGCLNVGQPCRGKDSLCCSGACEGKKPKKGKKDKRKCVGHNEGQCSLERNLCTAANPVQSACNPNIKDAFCFVTTGSGVVCGNVAGYDEAINCQACARDSDCIALGFPPGSACIVLTGGSPACNDGVNCAATNFRACIPPGI